MGLVGGPDVDDPEAICIIAFEGILAHNEVGRIGNSANDERFVSLRADAYIPPTAAPAVGMAICISTDSLELLSTPSVISLLW